MEISWDFVFFNGVYRSFLIFWKFINYCWFYRRDANWNHLYFSSPWDLIHHLEFLFGVCVCAWKGKHACSIASWHPHKITDVQLYHMHWYVMIYAMIVQMAAVPLRGACKYFPERCRHEEESQRQGHQTLGHWPGHFLTNFWLLKLPYENAGQTMA